MSKRLRPVDVQTVDEVRIFTVPRYKTSDFSGSEWRFSATTELRYKGKVLAQDSYRNVEAAMADVTGLLRKYSETAWKDLVNSDTAPAESDQCDQEGCPELATVTLRTKKTRCTSCGQDDDGGGETGGERRFCSAHSTRGDCSLNDADDNYEIVEGQQTAPDPQAESRSGFMIVDLTGPAPE